MHAAGFRLGIDFGTSHTVAVLRWPDGRAKPLLFDGSPLLPSAVYAEPAGVLAVGRDALHSARLDPARFEPNPKRRIDDGWVLLGDREVEVVELVAAVLGRVADEARRTAGGIPTAVTLSCPAAWGAARRRVLGAAAARAGLGEATLVEEPVAAATYFVRVLDHRMAVGSVVVVYDLGGGTFDVSVVERTADGFRPVATDGRDDIGGLDLDDALVRSVGELCRAQDPGAWQRLVAPSTADERRQRRLLWDDVRGVKERLSRHATGELHVPGMARDLHVTREEFEALARPLLAETVALTANLLRRSGTAWERMAGVFLVGGSSRIPLVHTMVHRGLQIAPTVIDQPELVVAEGTVLTQGTAGGGPTMVATGPLAAPPPPQPVPPPHPAAPAPTSPAPAPAPESPTGDALTVPTVAVTRAAAAGPAATWQPAPGPAASAPLGPAATAPAAPGPATTAPYPIIPASSRPRRGRRVLVAALAVIVINALAVAGIVFWPEGDRTGGGSGGDPSDVRPDLLYDGTRYGREIVLLARDGKRAILPAGGAIRTVIAVSTGWVLTREAGDNTDSAQFVDGTGRLLQQRDRVKGVSVNATGTRAAAQQLDGKIWIWDLTRTGDAIADTQLPADVRAVGWVGDLVLLRPENSLLFGTYDYWDPALGDYRPEHNDETLIALGGRADGNTLVAVSERDKKPCLVVVDPVKRFRPAGEPVCDAPVRLIKTDREDVLPLVSPDGRTLLARTASGEAAAYTVDDLIGGTATATLLGSVGGDRVARVSWTAGAVFVQTPDRYLRCQIDTGDCAVHEPAAEDGLPPTRLVVRFPA